MFRFRRTGLIAGTLAILVAVGLSACSGSSPQSAAPPAHHASTVKHSSSKPQKIVLAGNSNATEEVALYYPSVFGTKVDGSKAFTPQAVLKSIAANGRLGTTTYPRTGTVQILGAHYTGPVQKTVLGGAYPWPHRSLDLSFLKYGKYTVVFTLSGSVYRGEFNLVSHSTCTHLPAGHC